MQKLKRNINLGFRVTEAEKELIEKRMAQTGISNQRAYLLKMAVDGLVVNLDLSDVNECSRLLRTISNNVNQIAKMANTTGQIHTAGFVGVQKGLAEVWERQDIIIKSLAKILEAV